MNKKEKSALLAKGEERLAFFENGMDIAIQSKDVSLAWSYQRQYDGAAYMLEALELLSYAEYSARSGAVFERLLAAICPECGPADLKFT